MFVSGGKQKQSSNKEMPGHFLALDNDFYDGRQELSTSHVLLQQAIQAHLSHLWPSENVLCFTASLQHV